MNQPTMRAKTCTSLLLSLPHQRLRVAKKELDSENESVPVLRGDRTQNRFSPLLTAQVTVNPGPIQGDNVP